MKENLKKIAKELVMIVVKFFGWTTGGILAIYFWDNPIHTALVIKETVHSLLPIIIMGFLFLYLLKGLLR